MLMQNLVENMKMKDREDCNCNGRTIGCLDDCGEATAPGANLQGDSLNDRSFSVLYCLREKRSNV